MAPDSSTGAKPDALSESTLKVIIAMEKMQVQLLQYVSSRFAGRPGTPRLGFTSQKEVYNIFKKLFGDELFT